LDYCPVETLEDREEQGEFFDDIGTAADIYTIADVERVLLLDVSLGKVPCGRGIESKLGFLDMLLKR
jgi:uncharacterized protein YerC